jgi:4-hydroxyphenylacetate decarboxylase large subunit
MFDSGYTLPQGREVINYYYPLQYGYDKLIEMAKDSMAKVARQSGWRRDLPAWTDFYFYRSVVFNTGRYSGMAPQLCKRGTRGFLWQRLTLNVKKNINILQIYEQDCAHISRERSEALQMAYLIHIAVLNDDAISGLSPGRLSTGSLSLVLNRMFSPGLTTEDKSLNYLNCYR